ncbi:MAG: hypothetical protein ABW137_01605 [Mycobacterium sp.]
MGRHSASYIAAQQRLSTKPTTAAAYIGRVGALALALGIGAAVAGGTGIASAEGTTDTGASEAAEQASPNPSTETDPAEGPAAGESPSAESSSATTRKPGVPDMQLGNGRGGQPGDEQSAHGALDKLPALITGIPQKIAEALAPSAPAATTTPTTPLPDDHPSPRDRTNANANPTAAQSHTDLSAAAEASPPSFASRPADAAAANRGDVAPLQVAASTAAKQMSPPPTAVALSAPNSIAVLHVSSTPSQPPPANPIATVVSSVLSALGLASTASTTDDSPLAPPPIVQAVLQLVRRELDLVILNLSLTLDPTNPAHSVVPTSAIPSVTPGVPTPGDEASTAYGDIGKWMLQSNGQISNYGGVPFGGRTVLEPVNVIIVDPTSSSPAEAAWKLNTAMFWSGFPAQPIHSTGFQGSIDDVTYGQQPTGLLVGFSDGLFIFPNNHGRIFGPDPVETSTGYVWSGAFSTEAFVLHGLLPTHGYVSSNVARNALALRLIATGQATYGGVVPLNNSYNTATTTTGDHDGYAVVLILK